MKNILLVMCVLCFYMFSAAQTGDGSVIKEIKDFQNGLNNEYKDASTSPLPAYKRKTFKGIRFFPINTQYIVTASFKRTPGEKVIKVPTSGTEIQDYVKYGEAHFNLLGKEYTLGIYQSPELAKKEQYKNYLVIFFKDLTSGKETYGGGRYIDLTIPAGNTVTINFNKAYQPYCAYADGYNCPIPPKENYLPVKVMAGVKL